MSLPAAWAVQLALYDTLTTDPGLASVVPQGVRVHDAVPGDPVFPFLTIGEAKAEDYAGVPGAREHEIRIRAYSRWGGRRELKTIEHAVTERLHGGVLSVEGHRLVSMRLVFADHFRQPDGETFASVLRFRLVTQPEGTIA